MGTYRAAYKEVEVLASLLLPHVLATSAPVPNLKVICVPFDGHVSDSATLLAA